MVKFHNDQPKSQLNASLIEASFLPNFLQYQDYLLNDQFLITNQAIEQFQKFMAIPNKIYYDFESFNLPLQDQFNINPYTQIVNQISIIKDIKGSGIKHCENIVFDPLELNIEHFKKIIDLIYDDNSDQNAYVVYNKSFENSRLKEMAKMINEQAYYLKVIDIINNTIDLADFFNPNNH